jgi:hypothetical protein
MENLDLAKWLEMVWEALSEQDDMKRDDLLQAAEEFLQTESQEADVELPRAGSQNMAALGRCKARRVDRTASGKQRPTGPRRLEILGPTTVRCVLTSEPSTFSEPQGRSRGLRYQPRGKKRRE